MKGIWNVRDNLLASKHLEFAYKLLNLFSQALLYWMAWKKQSLSYFSLTNDKKKLAKFFNISTSSGYFGRISSEAACTSYKVQPINGNWNVKKSFKVLKRSLKILNSCRQPNCNSATFISGNALLNHSSKMLLILPQTPWQKAKSDPFKRLMQNISKNVAAPLVAGETK